MAVFKFYNVQLLPVEKGGENVGAEGYCRLFESLGALIEECKSKRLRLSSIAVKMRGDMYFSPFSVTVYEYDREDNKKLVYGSFLKFDDVDILVDTNSGETEYRSKGNTSSRRYDLEFYFDPSRHILAIQDARGLPTRKPLIGALRHLLGGHAIRLFKQHSLEIEELTSADSISDFLDMPKKGYKRYNGVVTFSNSDAFDRAIEGELKMTENELKDKQVGKWEASYRSFPGAIMSDLPLQAKIQMGLATKYGNAEVSYLDAQGERQKYQMEDYPVREQLKEREYKGIKGKALAVLNLIRKASEKTRLTSGTVKKNKKFLDKASD
ncbi:DUF4747 family protein [Serratia marcescens]|uniref:DUF4747 family protein n=1 Tax=Serratia marcescens TaxID=615 RepID=UPI0006ED13CB|nr:DUF4747 family protein [Serratia marcescens]ALL39891.1 DUF4747 domain-containing protein [Serratia marcescens]MCS3413250.1 DUF4747 family protein [Serratia marcescens]PHI44822.1 DUF4747 domain-containing protein [Serratia marcescens]UJA53690.1 DUF4747 family protein [Serratia marcescens]BEN27500.1 hypothetical protein SMKC032_35950 [Serratia marcescens]